MFRLAVIIILVAAIAIVLVHIRRQEAQVNYQIHCSLSRQVRLRRKLWDLRTQVGRLIAPNEVRRRAAEMALNLCDENTPPTRLAEADAGDFNN